MTARNPIAFAAGQAHRTAIDDLLRSRTQADPLLSPKEILRMLDWPDQRLRMVQRYVRSIRARGRRISVVQRHLSNDQCSLVFNHVVTYYCQCLSDP
jgi:hypothetical protein